MKNLKAGMVGVVLLAGVMTANDKVTIKGSDTMVILGQRWAELFMSAHTDAVIQVTGGGSGTGISALINGTTDICMSSRPMKRSEMEKLKEKYGSLGVEIRVARDGIALYIHEDNPVRELTLQQIKDIFTGKIRNWKEVGGPDTRIIAYSRENNSGTYVYFKEEVLNNADFAAFIQNMPGTAAVVNAIANDKNGIGYGGAAYGKGIREVLVKRDDDTPGYAPTLENINAGLYPITRFLFLYTRTRPDGSIKEFIDFALSKEGQEIVSTVGYFPIR